MEFTDQGLQLTRQEASDLAEVFSITAHLHDWGPQSQVIREPSTEEQDTARELSNLITPLSFEDMEVDNVVILEPHHFPRISKIAELALANSQKVVAGLCTPNVCNGYRSEWRPVAYRILAMTAEISESIKQKEQ